ncbi:unnamed protein product, partial [Meganyctiphanes norvegica]
QTALGLGILTPSNSNSLILGTAIRAQIQVPSRMFLSNNYKVMRPTLVFLCSAVSPLLLWPLQCSGQSTEQEVIDMHCPAIIPSGVSSVIFEKLPQTSSFKYVNADKLLLNEETIEAVNSKENGERETHHPLFQFFKNILSPTEREELNNFVWNSGLGPDPTSKHFLERNKNIRFIKVLEEGFEMNNKNYYSQSEHYNDYPGGFKRYYELIPEHLIIGPMNNAISFFIEQVKIPVNTIIMVQLQSSIIRANDNGRDVTGQGIHTDGSDDAMLVCIDRNNVQGAENQFHAALDGTQPLGNSTILEAGDGVIFRDNKLFHYVTDATTTVPLARRTLILIHSPEDGSGNVNPTNQYGTNDATVQLRYDSPFKCIDEEIKENSTLKYPQTGYSLINKESIDVVESNEN